MYLDSIRSDSFKQPSLNFGIRRWIRRFIYLQQKHIQFLIDHEICSKEFKRILPQILFFFKTVVRHFFQDPFHLRENAFFPQIASFIFRSQPRAECFFRPNAGRRDELMRAFLRDRSKLRQPRATKIVQHRGSLLFFEKLDFVFGSCQVVHLDWVICQVDIIVEVGEGKMLTGESEKLQSATALKLYLTWDSTHHKYKHRVNLPFGGAWTTVWYQTCACELAAAFQYIFAPSLESILCPDCPPLCFQYAENGFFVIAIKED